MAGALTALAFGASSCDWPVVTDYETRLAYVYEVSAPDTVDAGRSFVVSIRTGTPDPRWESAGDEVHSGSGGILIIPRNRLLRYGSQSYSAIVGDVRHVVYLRIGTPGRRQLFVRTLHVSSNGMDSTATLVRDLVVR